MEDISVFFKLLEVEFVSEGLRVEDFLWLYEWCFFVLY